MTAANITLFANTTVPTGQELDTNFLAYAVFCNIPCTLSGTNAITLAQNSNTPTLTQLTNYVQFNGIIANSNNGAVTLTHPSFGTLSVYKDTAAGPAALTGGELIQNNAVTFRYDSSLNAGSGGYHAYTNTQFAGGTITSNTIFSGAVLSVVGGSVGASLTSALLTGNSLTLSAALASVTNLEVGATAATLARMLSGLGTLTYSVTSANAVQDQSFALAGAQIRDSLSMGIDSIPSGVGFSGFIGTVGTVTLRLLNPSSVTIGAATLTVRATALGFA